MSFSRESRSRNAKIAAAFAGWGAFVWIALRVGPYLYALNNLIQWR